MGVAYCELNKALIAEKRGDYKVALERAKSAEKLFDQSKAGQEIAGDLRRIQAKVVELQCPEKR
jgi:hypothetical protein